MSTINLTEAETQNIRQVASRIENNLRYHFRIPDLAASIHMNEKKFKQGFRLLFSKPPYQYLIEKRLQHAQDLLLQQKSLRTIAMAVGFTGRLAENNFIRFFRKEMNTTPLAWKRLQEEKLVINKQLTKS